MLRRSKRLKTNNNNKGNDEVIDENESIQTNTDYKRDSFDDRVCDDLSEVLLTYLSFEDKFGFECISKQWKSLVFNKQKKLFITYKNIRLFLTKGKFISKTFENALKKLKRIDSIYINDNNINNRTIILSLITKHCNDLKSIRYDFSGIDVKTIESFGHKFGKSLQVLEQLLWPSPQNLHPLISLCNNLVSIKGIDSKSLFDSNGNLRLKTSKLEKCNFHSDFDIKQFEDFIDKYKQTLNVSIVFTSAEFVNNCLIQLSKVVNLKEFNIKLCFNEMTDNLDNSLTLISNNCKNLEKLRFTGVINTSYTIPLKLISQLKHLKYLSFDTNLFSGENGNDLSVKSFNGLTNLIHLTVKNLGTGDNFFKDIDKYLPQLRVLYIICDQDLVLYPFEYNEKYVLTDLLFIYLSNLTNIVKIKIKHELRFKYKAFEVMVNNCKQLKSFQLFNDQRIHYLNNKTVNSLISLAVKNPKIDFKFDFCVTKNIVSYTKLLYKPNNIFLDLYIPGVAYAKFMNVI